MGLKVLKLAFVVLGGVVCLAQEAKPKPPAPLPRFVHGGSSRLGQTGPTSFPGGMAQLKTPLSTDSIGAQLETLKENAAFITEVASELSKSMTSARLHSFLSQESFQTYLRANKIGLEVTDDCLRQLVMGALMQDYLIHFNNTLAKLAEKTPEGSPMQSTGQVPSETLLFGALAARGNFTDPQVSALALANPGVAILAGRILEGYKAQNEKMDDRSFAALLGLAGKNSLADGASEREALRRTLIQRLSEKSSSFDSDIQALIQYLDFGIAKPMWVSSKAACQSVDHLPFKYSGVVQGNKPYLSEIFKLPSIEDLKSEFRQFAGLSEGQKDKWNRWVEDRHGEDHGVGSAARLQVLKSPTTIPDAAASNLAKTRRRAATAAKQFERSFGADLPDDQKEKLLSLDPKSLAQLKILSHSQAQIDPSGFKALLHSVSPEAVAKAFQEWEPLILSEDKSDLAKTHSANREKLLKAQRQLASPNWTRQALVDRFDAYLKRRTGQSLTESLQRQSFQPEDLRSRASANDLALVKAQLARDLADEVSTVTPHAFSESVFPQIPYDFIEAKLSDQEKRLASSAVPKERQPIAQHEIPLLQSRLDELESLLQGYELERMTPSHQKTEAGRLYLARLAELSGAYGKEQVAIQRALYGARARYTGDESEVPVVDEVLKSSNAAAAVLPRSFDDPNIKVSAERLAALKQMPFSAQMEFCSGLATTIHQQAHRPATGSALKEKPSRTYQLQTQIVEYRTFCLSPDLVKGGGKVLATKKMALITPSLIASHPEKLKEWAPQDYLDAIAYFRSKGESGPASLYRKAYLMAYPGKGAPVKWPATVAALQAKDLDALDVGEITTAQVAEWAGSAPFHELVHLDRTLALVALETPPVSERALKAARLRHLLFGPLEAVRSESLARLGTFFQEVRKLNEEGKAAHQDIPVTYQAISAKASEMKVSPRDLRNWATHLNDKEDSESLAIKPAPNATSEQAKALRVQHEDVEGLVAGYSRMPPPFHEYDQSLKTQIRTWEAEATELARQIKERETFFNWKGSYEVGKRLTELRTKIIPALERKQLRLEEVLDSNGDMEAAWRDWKLGRLQAGTEHAEVWLDRRLSGRPGVPAAIQGSFPKVEDFERTLKEDIRKYQDTVLSAGIRNRDGLLQTPILIEPSRVMGKFDGAAEEQQAALQKVANLRNALFTEFEAIASGELKVPNVDGQQIPDPEVRKEVYLKTLAHVLRTMDRTLLPGLDGAGYRMTKKHISNLINSGDAASLGEYMTRLKAEIEARKKNESRANDVNDWEGWMAQYYGIALPLPSRLALLHLPKGLRDQLANGIAKADDPAKRAAAATALLNASAPDILALDAAVQGPAQATTPAVGVPVPPQVQATPPGLPPAENLKPASPEAPPPVLNRPLPGATPGSALLSALRPSETTEPTPASTPTSVSVSTPTAHSERELAELENRLATLGGDGELAQNPEANTITKEFYGRDKSRRDQNTQSLDAVMLRNSDYDPQSLLDNLKRYRGLREKLAQYTLAEQAKPVPPGEQAPQVIDRVAQLDEFLDLVSFYLKARGIDLSFDARMRFAQIAVENIEGKAVLGNPFWKYRLLLDFFCAECSQGKSDGLVRENPAQLEALDGVLLQPSAEAANQVIERFAQGLDKELNRMGQLPSKEKLATEMATAALSGKEAEMLKHAPASALVSRLPLSKDSYQELLAYLLLDQNNLSSRDGYRRLRTPAKAEQELIDLAATIVLNSQQHQEGLWAEAVKQGKMTEPQREKQVKELRDQVDKSLERLHASGGDHRDVAANPKPAAQNVRRSFKAENLAISETPDGELSKPDLYMQYLLDEAMKIPSRQDCEAAVALDGERERAKRAGNETPAIQKLKWEKRGLVDKLRELEEELAYIEAPPAGRKKVLQQSQQAFENQGSSGASMAAVFKAEAEKMAIRSLAVEQQIGEAERALKAVDLKLTESTKPLVTAMEASVKSQDEKKKACATTFEAQVQKVIADYDKVRKSWASADDKEFEKTFSKRFFEFREELREHIRNRIKWDESSLLCQNRLLDESTTEYTDATAPLLARALGGFVGAKLLDDMVLGPPANQRPVNGPIRGLYPDLVREECERSGKNLAVIGPIAERLRTQHHIYYDGHGFDFSQAILTQRLNPAAAGNLKPMEQQLLEDFEHLRPFTDSKNNVYQQFLHELANSYMESGGTGYVGVNPHTAVRVFKDKASGDIKVKYVSLKSNPEQDELVKKAVADCMGPTLMHIIRGSDDKGKRITLSPTLRAQIMHQCSTQLSLNSQDWLKSAANKVNANNWYIQTLPTWDDAINGNGPVFELLKKNSEAAKRLALVLDQLTALGDLQYDTPKEGTRIAKNQAGQARMDLAYKFYTMLLEKNTEMDDDVKAQLKQLATNAGLALSGGLGGYLAGAEQASAQGARWLPWAMRSKMIQAAARTGVQILGGYRQGWMFGGMNAFGGEKARGFLMPSAKNEWEEETKVNGDYRYRERNLPAPPPGMDLDEDGVLSHEEAKKFELPHMRASMQYQSAHQMAKTFGLAGPVTGAIRRAGIPYLSSPMGSTMSSMIGVNIANEFMNPTADSWVDAGMQGIDAGLYGAPIDDWGANKLFQLSKRYGISHGGRSLLAFLGSLVINAGVDCIMGGIDHTRGTWIKGEARGRYVSQNFGEAKSWSKACEYNVLDGWLTTMAASKRSLYGAPKEIAEELIKAGATPAELRELAKDVAVIEKKGGLYPFFVQFMRDRALPGADLDKVEENIFKGMQAKEIFPILADPNHLYHQRVLDLTGKTDIAEVQAKYAEWTAEGMSAANPRYWARKTNKNVPFSKFLEYLNAPPTP